MVGGTSLGANVALELATREPEKVRGLFIEMPVLDNALTGVAAFFTPIMLGLRFGRPAFELASRVDLRPIPRTHHLVDMGLDLLRQRPGPVAGGARGPAPRRDRAAPRGAADDRPSRR